MPDVYLEDADITVSLAIDDAWELDFDAYLYDFLVACEGLRYAAQKWCEHEKEQQ